MSRGKAVIVINPATGTEWNFGSVTEITEELGIDMSTVSNVIKGNHRLFNYNIYYLEDYKKIQEQAREQTNRQEKHKSELYNLFVTEDKFIYCKNSEWEVQANVK